MDNNDRLYGYWRIAMWGGAIVLLSLPAFAMQFTSEVNWTARDFITMGAMLLIACSAIEIGARMSKNLFYRAGVIVAVGTGFVTVWVNLAAGMIQSERNPINLVFLGVLAISVLGACVVRFAAGGMARTMLVAGIAQASIAVYVAVAALDNHYTSMLIGLFALPWWLSAGLFRAAAKQSQRQLRS